MGCPPARRLLGASGVPARMSCIVPVGTEIFPYSSESGEVGIGRLITMELDAENRWSSGCRIRPRASWPTSTAYHLARILPHTTATSFAHVTLSEPSRLPTPLSTLLDVFLVGRGRHTRAYGCLSKTLLHTPLRTSELLLHQTLA